MKLEENFTEIYNKHVPKVYRLCLGYASGDENLAKDWVQETFIKVWNHRKSFREKSSVSTWIYRIAVNICLSDLRKTKQHKILNTAIDKSEITAQEEHCVDENIQKMYHCIKKLNTKNKTLILLELEEVPQINIAETLGIGHGSVRTRLSRLKKILLKCIKNEQ